MQAQEKIGQRPQSATGEINILSKEGDTKHYWNASDPSEVASVKAVFDAFRSRGYTAARMGRAGTAGEVITEFDPSAGSILFIPRVAGG